MIYFCFGKENNSSRRVILKIELELNNLNPILSRSAVTPVFPAGYFPTHHEYHCQKRLQHFPFDPEKWNLRWRSWKVLGRSSQSVWADVEKT